MSSSSRSSTNSYAPHRVPRRPANSHLIRLEFFGTGRDRIPHLLYTSSPMRIPPNSQIRMPAVEAYIERRVRRLVLDLDGPLEGEFDVVYKTPAGYIPVDFRSTPRSIGADPEDTIRVVLYDLM